MDPFIGQIQPFGFNFPPRGWAFCDGQLLAISSNTALFSLLGTTFGGDGRTSFGLPDLRGRSIVHVGTGPGLSTIRWGEKGGSETINVALANMPAHSHLQQIPVNGADGANTDDPQNHFLGNTGVNNYNTASTSGQFLGGGSTASAGSGLPIQSRNPFLGISMSIATVGIFPSRN